MPLCLPGGVHPSNKNCVDWNSSGAIAYGSHNTLIIIDASTYKRVQILKYHDAAIENVCWSPLSGTSSSSDTFLIASSDISGQIIVTNAVSAVKLSQFSLTGTSVIAIKWPAWDLTTRCFLLALHSPGMLVLWNTETGSRVWTHTYTHSLSHMALDPFSSEQLAFGGTGTSILVVKDINTYSEPFTNGYLTPLTSDTSSSSSIQCLHYHKAYRNTLFVVAGGQLYVFDTELYAILYKGQLEPNSIVISSCSFRDAFFTVQTNGSISLRMGTYASKDDHLDARLGYEKVCFSETLRHGPQQKVIGIAVCPRTESTVAVLYNSGKIVFWQLIAGDDSTQYLHSFIDDSLTFDTSLATKTKGTLRLYQAGCIGSLTTGVSCLRMRPMNDIGNAKDDSFANTIFGASHIGAVGTQSGIVHLVDVFTSNILKEFSVQSSPIKFLEWGGPYLVLSAGYNHALSTTQIVRNDIFGTDIRTGISRRIRPESDESPISLMRVSFYHCYLALAFHREPLEIWDLKSLRLMRKMSRTCPLIIDMAWSTKHHGMKTTENSGQSVYKENLVVLDSDNRLYHVIVKGLHVRDGKEVNTQWKSGGWSIRNMAWKDDTLAMGDADGRIAVWDLSRRQSRHVRSSRLPVLRMCFSGLAGDYTLAVLHQRELSLWDTEALTRMHHVLFDPSRAAVDMDLCGVSPLIITNDNVFEFSPGSSKNNPMSVKDTPLLMNSQYVNELLTDFDNGVSNNDVMTFLREKANVAFNDEDSSSLNYHSIMARYLGDDFTFNLLEVVKYYMEAPKNNQLPPRLQMFWPNDTFKERELRVTCSACISPNVMESRLVERAVVAGGRAKERAVDRLISSNDLRHASMKAALLVSSQDSDQARSLIKLIATNLIASDMIEDGVELLFLVGSGADACKYLQSQKQWNKSAVYAKMGLEDPDDVIMKWISHLKQEQPNNFVLAKACLCDWSSVVEHLNSMGKPRLARLVLHFSTKHLGSN